MVGGLDGVVVENMGPGRELVESRGIRGFVGGERLRRISLRLDGMPDGLIDGSKEGPNTNLRKGFRDHPRDHPHDRLHKFPLIPTPTPRPIPTPITTTTCPTPDPLQDEDTAPFGAPSAPRGASVPQTGVAPNNG